MSDTTTEQRASSQTSLEDMIGGALMDIAALAGAGSITFGVWQIFHPAAYIVGGAFVLAGALAAARRSA